MQDLLTIKPHEVSSAISGYAIGIYAEPGVGKTTTAMSAPRPILGAAEMGYKALPGVIAFNIQSWTDALSFAAQLKKPEVKERFDTVVIDTMDELVFYAEEFICQSNGVKTLNEMSWGAGHQLLYKMFKRFFRDITHAGYGLIVIAHAAIKQDENDPNIKYATLGFNKKVKQIVMGLLDVLVYVSSNRDPGEPNIMHFRSSQYWEAKSRFRNITADAVLSYENLEKAIQNAVKGVATTDRNINIYEEDGDDSGTRDEFEALKEELMQIASTKIEKLGPELILSEINLILLKKISETNLSDYPAMVILKDKLNTL